MKANPRPDFRLALLAALLLSACVEAPPSPPAAQPMPQPVTQPPAPAPVAADWRDAPLAPGRWQLRISGAGSSANFAGLSVRCEGPQKPVVITRKGAANSAVQPLMTLTAATLHRTLNATPAAEPAAVSVALPSRDSLLDALAFARGRWMVEVPGLAPLIVPADTSLSRVVEDCRKPR